MPVVLHGRLGQMPGRRCSTTCAREGGPLDLTRFLHFTRQKFNRSKFMVGVNAFFGVSSLLFLSRKINKGTHWSIKKKVGNNKGTHSNFKKRVFPVAGGFGGCGSSSGGGGGGGSGGGS